MSDSRSSSPSESACVTAVDAGRCLLAVRVTPGAKKKEVGGLHQGALKVSVTQIAEKGKANQEVLKVLAEFLHLKNSQLLLQSGETSRMKKILCRDISAAELQRRIESLS